MGSLQLCVSVTYVEALKDFERQDLVRQPCLASSASSLTHEETPVSKSAVGIFTLYTSKRKSGCSESVLLSCRCLDSLSLPFCCLISKTVID